MAEQVESSEELGRCVVRESMERTIEKHIAKGMVLPFKPFLEDQGKSISVHRLSRMTSQAEAVAYGEEVAQAISTKERKRWLRGWMILSAAAAECDGRIVKASPHAGNPHHADIEVPDMSKETRIEHARSLAKASRWHLKGRPLPQFANQPRATMP